MANGAITLKPAGWSSRTSTTSGRLISPMRRSPSMCTSSERRSSYRGRRASGPGDLAGGRQRLGHADRKAGIAYVAARGMSSCLDKVKPILMALGCPLYADAEPRSTRSRTIMTAKNFSNSVDMKSRVFGETVKLPRWSAPQEMGLIRSETNRFLQSRCRPGAPIKSP